MDNNYKETIMSSILSYYIGDHQTVGEKLSSCDAGDIRDLIQHCMELLRDNHDIDVDDLENAIDALEIVREYDVSVTVSFDLSVRVKAKSDEDAESYIRDDCNATDLITEMYDDDIVSVDTQHIGIDVQEVSEA
tara:strand:- start:6166 stop:6567 length:402 start_codon:yes stop_codon:yes gene_type:complete